MNIVYFIGNGFDLNAGLNTKYKDFYKDLIENDGDKLAPEIVKLKDSISNYVKDEVEEIDWSDAELGFGEFMKLFKGKETPDSIIANCHNFICERLSSYLDKEENRFPYARILKDDSLLTELWTGFTDISRGLRPIDKNKVNAYVDSIDGGFNVRILDFNYTNLLDKLISQIEKKKLYGSRKYRHSSYGNQMSCLHVHGTTRHGLAFGLNDETQYDKSIFEGGVAEYSRQVIKPLFVSDMGEEIQENAKRIIDSADVFYIYGMSVGLTDLYWWKLLLNRMVSNKRCILIIHDISVPPIELSPIPYRIDLRKRREKMLSFIPKISEEDKTPLINRIYTSHGNIFDCLESIVDLTETDVPKTPE